MKAATTTTMRIMCAVMVTLLVSLTAPMLWVGIPADVLYYQEKISFRSPIVGYDRSGASYVGSGGSVGAYWDVTDSYGRFKLSGSYSYRLCLLGALEW